MFLMSDWYLSVTTFESLINRVIIIFVLIENFKASLLVRTEEAGVRRAFVSTSTSN